MKKIIVYVFVGFLFFAAASSFAVSVSADGLPKHGWRIISDLGVGPVPGVGSEHQRFQLTSGDFVVNAYCDEPSKPNPPVGTACDYYASSNTFWCGDQYQKLVPYGVLRTPEPTPIPSNTPTATATSTETPTPTATPVPPTDVPPTEVPPTKTVKPPKPAPPVPTSGVGDPLLVQMSIGLFDTQTFDVGYVLYYGTLVLIAGLAITLIVVAVKKTVEFVKDRAERK